MEDGCLKNLDLSTESLTEWKQSHGPDEPDVSDE